VIENLSEKHEIILRDMIGNVVDVAVITRANTGSKIDLSTLPQGVYLLELRDNGMVFCSKIVRL
jgi:hypothetical protein